jgi:hypothetical protein
LTQTGQFSRVARVKLNFNCGTLEVATTDDDTWSVSRNREGSDSAAISVGADGDSLRVESGRNDRWWGGRRQHWIVKLPTQTSYQLEVAPNAAETHLDLGGGTFTSVSIQPNAGSLFLDLTDASVDQLTLSVNAGSATVIIGPGASLDASLSVNAGSIEVCTIGDVALQVISDPNITFSTNLDESGLEQSGDSWSTADYADATDKVHIQLEGNAGSFELNPEGGCA